jgi:hypothetical protein
MMPHRKSKRKNAGFFEGAQDNGVFAIALRDAQERSTP